LPPGQTRLTVRKTHRPVFCCISSPMYYSSLPRQLFFRVPLLIERTLPDPSLPEQGFPAGFCLPPWLHMKHGRNVLPPFHPRSGRFTWSFLSIPFVEETASLEHDPFQVEVLRGSTAPLVPFSLYASPQPAPPPPQRTLPHPDPAFPRRRSIRASPMPKCSSLFSLRSGPSTQSSLISGSGFLAFM